VWWSEKVVLVEDRRVRRRVLFVDSSAETKPYLVTVYQVVDVEGVIEGVSWFILLNDVPGDKAPIGRPGGG